MSQSTSIKDIAQEPGVRDLPIRVKGPFAQAIKYERMGKNKKAQEKLEVAIKAEES